MEGRRKRMLSQEEEALWARVTRHDTPLARPAPKPALPEATEQKTSQPATAKPKAGSKPVAPLPAALPVKPVKQPPAAPQPAPFDHREAKRLARGQREIDARLDLHGLRQHDAYLALRRFLAQAQAKGHRHVLIITGKGKADSSTEMGFWTSEERGVLRRLVPHWLGEPSFRMHVVSFTQSASHHGGSGALYVTIRKGPAKS
jgi:DNA-nicking Smr family endonuclease